MITSFVQNHVGIVSFIGGILVSFLSWSVVRPLDKNKYDRRRVASFFLSDKWHSRYKIMISGMLNLFDWLIGKRFIVKKEQRNWINLWVNFKRHYLIASFYPLAFFLLSWIFGGPKGIGQLSLMQDESRWWIRALFFLLLAVFVYAEWWVLRDSKRGSERSIRLLRRLLRGVYSGHDSVTELRMVVMLAIFTFVITFISYILFFTNSLLLSFVFTIIPASIILFVGISIGPEKDRGAIAKALAVMIAIVFATVFIGIITDSEGGMFVGGIISVGAFLGAGLGGASIAMVMIAGASAFTFINVGATAFALALMMILVAVVGANVRTIIATIVILTASIAVFNSVAISFLLFFMLFPVINGFFDMLSTWFSRVFFEKIKKDISNEDDLIVGRIRALLFALADLLFAVLFLFCLAFVFFFVLQGFDSFLETDLGAGELIREVFNTQECWWIVLMLMSTLVPTLVNFLSILLSFFLCPRRLCRKCADFLNQYRSGSLDRVPLGLYALLLFFISFVMIGGMIDGTLFLFDSYGMSIIKYLQNTANFAVQLASVVF